MTYPRRTHWRVQVHWLPMVIAAAAFGGSMLVIAFGVIATSGTYGSRLAWFFGIAVPLLALSVLLTSPAPGWRPGTTHRRAAPASGAVAIRRAVRVGALVLVGAPAALVAMLLTTYGMIFVVHGVSVM